MPNNTTPASRSLAVQPCGFFIFLVLLLLAAPAAVEAQFKHTNADGSIYGYSANADGVSIAITGYWGPPWVVSIPTNLDAMTVASIGNTAFLGCRSLASVTIPGSVTSIGITAFDGCSTLASVTIPGTVTNIGGGAFSFCPELASVFFAGNAPAADSTVFDTNFSTTAYYLTNTTGWSNTFGGIPAVLWDPLIQATDGSFGVQNNQFGFDITNGGTTNIPIVVEACANLASPVWTPLQSLTLTNSFYFSDPEWTNYPARFYRISSP